MARWALARPGCSRPIADGGAGLPIVPMADIATASSAPTPPASPSASTPSATAPSASCWTSSAKSCPRVASTPSAHSQLTTGNRPDHIHQFPIDNSPPHRTRPTQHARRSAAPGRPGLSRLGAADPHGGRYGAGGAGHRRAGTVDVRLPHAAGLRRSAGAWLRLPGGLAQPVLGYPCRGHPPTSRRVTARRLVSRAALDRCRGRSGLYPGSSLRQRPARPAGQPLARQAGGPGCAGSRYLRRAAERDLSTRKP